LQGGTFAEEAVSIVLVHLQSAFFEAVLVPKSNAGPLPIKVACGDQCGRSTSSMDIAAHRSRRNMAARYVDLNW
jgi:hypothetical protein